MKIMKLWNHELFWTLLNCDELSWIFKNFQELSWTFMNFHELSWSFENHKLHSSWNFESHELSNFLELAWTFKNYQELSRTFKNFHELFKKSRSHETLQTQGDCAAMEHRCDSNLEKSWNLNCSSFFLRCFVAEVSLFLGSNRRRRRGNYASLH